MKFILNINILLILLCAFVSLSNAQIAVTNFPPYDNEENLVVDILLGNGITASNFSSVGFVEGIGYFDGFNANIGFAEGVILSTGGLDFVTGGFGIGSAISGDDDLELALNAINLTWPVNNVTILEFDFIAESESMAFNYVFGSMEYTSYTCSQYNDIFGFFLSGPGITGPYSNNAINLAYIPDPNNPGQYTTTPVAVNTVNSGAPSGFNASADCDNIDPLWTNYNIYWVDNQYDPILNDWQGVNDPPEPTFTVEGVTGFTTPLTAEYNNLICGETYHIKLAIADASDGALNSVVFLEANSFSSPEVAISTVPNADLGLVLDADNGVLEGCGTAALQFDRSGDMTMDLIITLDYSGEAEYGVDYNELPTEMILPAFQDQVVIPIDVFYDDLLEGEETLIVTVTGVPVACEDIIVQDIELIIFDQESLAVDMPSEVNMSCLGSASIEVSVNGGYAPYTYDFYNESGELLESGELNFNQSPEESTSYTLLVTDACLDQQFEDVVNVIVSQDELSVGLEDDLLLCEDDINSIILSPIINGTPPFNYTWFYDGVVISNEDMLSSVPGEGLYQLVVEDACGVISGDEQLVSFIELAPYVDLISYDVLNPELLPESCFESILQFNMQEIQDQDITINFDISGSAVFGSDYLIESTSVTILAGEDVAYMPISILSDNIEEGVEAIEFSFPFIDSCSGFPDEIIVQIYDAPALSVELDTDLILCEEDVDSGVLDGFVSGGIGLVNYGWYFNDNMISTDLDLETESLETGVYSLIAVDQCGNTSASSINYDIITLTPTVTLSSSSSSSDPALLLEGCNSSVLTFDLPYAASADQVFYYNINSSSNTFLNGVDIEPINDYVEFPAGVTSVDVEIVPLLDDIEEDSETILFEFLFSNSCVPQNDISLEVLDYSSLAIFIPDQQSLCVGQNLYLEAQYTGGFPPYDVSWTYEGDSENQEWINIEVEEGILPAVFTVEDACGYSASSEVLIEGVSIDDFIVTWPPEEVFACYGDNSEIILSLEGGLPPFTYEWFLNGNPIAEMLPMMDENEIYGPIFNQAENILPDATQLIPTSTSYTPFTYDYQVIITDSCANELEYEIEVNIDDCALPTAFTPNGDGNNDVLWIDFGDLSTPVGMQIFNRWGSLVYQSADYTPCAEFKSECWNGQHFQRYGEKCNPGTYYYVLTYSNPINNVDSYDASRLIDGIFGTPHERSLGRKRTGSVLLTR